MSRLVSKADILFALGYTPADAAALASYLAAVDAAAAFAPKAGPTFSGAAAFLGLVDVQSGLLQLSSNAPMLTLGKAGQVSSPILRFLSSGNVGRTYDAQLTVTGGSAASDGKGVVNLTCNGFTINGQSIAWGTASPSVSLPLTNGPTALLGVSLNYAREDHVHQSDSTRAAATNPTLDGTVSLGTNTQAALTVQLNGTTASNRRIRLLTAGSVRWTFGVPAGSEPGSNAGSDFNVNSYDDNGTILSPVPMVIRRSDGRVTFGGAVVMGGALSGVTTLAMSGALSGVTTLGMNGGLSGVTSLGMNGALSGVTTYAGSGNAAINLNAAAAPSLPISAMLNLTAADTTSNGVMVSTFGTGTQSGYNGRSAGGTAGTLALTPAANTLVMLAGYGYDGSTWAFGGSCELRSSAAWSGTSRPTFWRWSTVAVGATATTQRMQLHPSGNLTIQPAGGTFTDDGANALQVAGSAAITMTAGGYALNIKNTTASNGAIILLQGDGATTPNKAIRAYGGAFQVVNSGNTTVILNLSDAGALVVSDLTLSTDTSQSSVSGAWTTAASTVAATGGTWSGTGSIRYKKIGRLVFFNLAVTGITNTSGLGGITATLPFANQPPGSGLTMCTGRDNTTGKTLQGYITSGTTTLSLVAYDGTFPSGTALYASGVYEATT